MTFRHFNRRRKDFERMIMIQLPEEVNLITVCINSTFNIRTDFAFLHLTI